MRAVRRRGSFVKDSSSASAPTPRAQPVSSSSHFLAAPLSSSHARREPALRPIDEAVFDIAPLLEWADRDESEGAEPPPEPEDDTGKP